MQPTEARDDGELPLADHLAIESAKTLLRRAVGLRRDTRPASQRKSDDAARFELIRSRLAGSRPVAVAAYLSTGSEPGTMQLVAWLAAYNVPILLPVVSAQLGGEPGALPAWAPYAGPDALRPSAIGILEPTTPLAPAEALAGVNLVVCPALAVNPEGHRLGRGGGWYDRALPHFSKQTHVWALLNDDEVLDVIPTQSWDQPVGAIVTPTRFLECASPGSPAHPSAPRR